jgi:hypothetical protein
MQNRNIHAEFMHLIVIFIVLVNVFCEHKKIFCRIFVVYC